ncbi:hypothetical protein EDD15DRAFT_2371999 [Pisolithus albus]|nr:hypothetical protein EDD15DRAFT_2371999 [Pisolithus albus]
MPKAKANRGGLKMISCPRCGKRFFSETNVLQHMNQPTGTCRFASWHEECSRSFSQARCPPSDNSVPCSSINRPPHFPSADSNAYQDWDLNPPSPEVHETEDFTMDAPEEVIPLVPGKFVEVYEGSSEVFPGGKSFMDTFHEDQYSGERRSNLYFPFASQQEWQFASWLLRSRLSLTAIDSLLALDIGIPLSFRTGKQLRARAEVLPSGPAWLCEEMEPESPTKHPVRLFYRQPLECLQSLLSHPLLAPHISFVPRKVWTSAARVCRIYDEWLSGDRAWEIQDALPRGATVLGVVLSSDKTNISVMTGNRVAHPVLISLANIDASIRSKTSLHGYLLLALLPIPKFVHKTTRVRGLLQDRLIHQALNRVLTPLKTAATVGIMMSDPAGNLRYCYTPLASWIADTPEECLIAATSPKASPITTATSKNFGDPFRHPPRTSSITLSAIQRACAEQDPFDYKNFIKVIRALRLNGVVEPVWKGWPLSEPSDFITPEPLHHFHRFSWDHDTRWCILATGAAEFDYRFSLLQTLVGYRAFEDGVSKLKQVTGRDHRAVQRYIVGVIAGSVPRRFLTAIRSLMDFRYLAQAPMFTDDSLTELASALQDFYDNKDAITAAGARKDSWEIPKLELLQSIVPSIRLSGAVMQWSADPTEHAHVQEIKVPARAGNNRDYYNQIARHLDRAEKCLRFDIATYMESKRGEEDLRVDEIEGNETEQDKEHEPDEEEFPTDHLAATRSPINYFTIADALVRGCIPNAPRPYRTFSTATTAFHLSTKPSLRLSVDEAAAVFNLPDLRAAISEYLHRLESGMPHRVSGVRSQQDHQLPFDRLQIWCKVRVQQMRYHSRQTPDTPQTLRAFHPSTVNPHGLYDAAIVNADPDSDWPQRGLEGHSVVQLRMIFRPLHSELLAAYVQRFDVVAQQGNTNNRNAGTGMYLVRRAVRSNGSRIGDVLPITLIRSPAHLIPHFGKEAHSRLTSQTSYELSSDFWLNKYWSKEFYYALSSSSR